MLQIFLLPQCGGFVCFCISWFLFEETHLYLTCLFFVQDPSESAVTLSRSDIVHLLSASAQTLLRRDMSLNRRLYAWLLGTVQIIATFSLCVIFAIGVQITLVHTLEIECLKTPGFICIYGPSTAEHRFLQHFCPRIFREYTDIPKHCIICIFAGIALYNYSCSPNPTSLEIGHTECNRTYF